ncbi:MAG: DUF3656 domain-containing protein [Tissierellia bacterium]|nr:DUF3656 domain-containing protein [Tissierellia bacterium]
MAKDSVEILAPAGNKEMVHSAILAGADAIYMGTGDFNARAYTESFDDESLKEIIKLCHLHDVKLYITMNTLLYNHELEKAYELCHKLYDMDVDALIVQDLGLISILKKHLPEMELHASTQMNIHHFYGAKMMEDLGFQRIVLARETPWEEICRIKRELEIEVEIFVHGSLCVCQSGQCYFSQRIGGRSGNRGACAQPCRKNYRLYDEKQNLVADWGAYLSPRDLNTIEEMERFKEMQIDSLKIEGRMKTPEYVYSVVKNYRESRDHCSYNEKELEEVGNRGYTKGLLFDDFKHYGEKKRRGQKGRILGEILPGKKKTIRFYENVKKGDIFLIENQKGDKYPLTLTRDHKKNEKAHYSHIYDAKVPQQIRRVQNRSLKEECRRDLPKIPVNIQYSMEIGKNARFLCKAKGKSVEVMGDIVEGAKKIPLEKEKLEKQFTKLGNTPFEAMEICGKMDESIFYPVKKLNELRRLAMDKLLDEITQYPIHRSPGGVYHFTKEKRKERKTIFRDPINEESCFKMPYFMGGNEIDNWEEFKEDISSILLRNIGDLQWVKEKYPDKTIIADYPINILNTEAVHWANEWGFDEICLSIEAKPEEGVEIRKTTAGVLEYFTYGDTIVMTNVFCPFSLINEKCDRNCQKCYYQKGYLEDEFGEIYPVIRDGISHIYFHDKLDHRHHIQELKNGNFDYLRIQRGDFCE